MSTHPRVGMFPDSAYTQTMLGSSLNGARVALVATALFTVIVAAALGYWTAALVLLAASAIHGVLWWWLYQRRQAPSG